MTSTLAGYPCTTNTEHFEILFAPTSPHFMERITDVASGDRGLHEAQRQNAAEGYQFAELTQSMKGWALFNRQASLGGPGWYTPFAESREIALLAAEAWYKEDPQRREIIVRKNIP